MGQEGKMSGPHQVLVLRALPGCSGCRICEIVCSMRHANTVNPDKSRVRVYQAGPGPIDIPVVCQYCDDRPCVAACPYDALTYNDETFTMHVDAALCMGKTACGVCYQACVNNGRGGCITFTPVTEKAQICDLCEGDAECTKYCPSDTLKLIPASPMAKRMAKPVEVFAERLAEQFWPAKETV